MSKEIKIYNKLGELVRIFGEEQSDDNGSYQEKAKMFAEKNGFSMNEAKVVEEEIIAPVDMGEPTTEDLAAVGVEVSKPKKAKKKK